MPISLVGAPVVDCDVQRLDAARLIPEEQTQEVLLSSSVVWGLYDLSFTSIWWKVWRLGFMTMRPPWPRFLWVFWRGFMTGLGLMTALPRRFQWASVQPRRMLWIPCNTRQWRRVAP